MTTLAIIWGVSALILAIYIYLYEEEVILKEAVVCFSLAPLTLLLLIVDSFKGWNKVVWRKKK